MTDQTVPPQFVDEEASFPRPVRPARTPANMQSRQGSARSSVTEKRLTFWGTLDKPLLVMVGLMLALGLMMVFSATFDWSLQEFGSETAILFSHVRNVIIGLVAMLIFSRLDPRIVRRLSVVIMLMAISFLIAVLLFGDDTFGARRALINGRFQPGEFSELAMIIYMAAWLGSKNMRVRSLAYGLIPFITMVLIVTGLVILQPDLSTAVVIFITSAVMFFLAGADMRQIGIVAGVVFIVSLFSFPLLQQIAPYATGRINDWVAGVSDLTQASYHTQQAAIALRYGGWTGVGLGESEAKFLALPAPHTDSIFAVIGEELGVMGASVVIALYLAFTIRGFQISRQAVNTYSALLAAGITIWVASKAMLNIAVMTGLVPPTGLPLPFISFGGSSLVVLLVVVGILLAIQRESLIQQNNAERRKPLAHYDRSRRDRGTRVSRTGSRRSDGQTVS
ncbi:MAG: FtsW/RodA/SpoVE family cell cycle protein [Chloroflexota bacterium]